jgi:predicted nucleotidyltransferase component of viral defense system
MPLSWDPRVVPPALLEFVKAVQEGSLCRLSGGAALSGVHLRHRLSNDLDLFCDERQDVREVLRACSDTASDAGGDFKLVRDGGTFVRARLSLKGQAIEVDIAHEPSTPLAPRDVVEGVIVDSLSDMQANKITCLLSRSEPRDLVDLYFLDRAQRKPEDFLRDALTKDAGVDPGVLSYLLKEFPTAPLPVMLERLDQDSLRSFRDELSERFRAAGVPMDSDA